MVNKLYPVTMSNKMKKLLASLLFISLFILTLIFLRVQKVYAQIGFYNPFTSYSSIPYGINASPTYSNGYFTASNYAPSYYQATPSYSVQNSFYYPNSSGYTSQGFYYPNTAGSVNAYAGSYYTSQNSFYYPGGATSYPTQGSYYYTNTGSSGQTNSYYNPTNTYYTSTNSYNPFSPSYYPNTTAYYPNTTSYYPNTGGYVTNAVINITGTYDGRWVRNFSATGAATTSSRTGNSNMRSTNSTSGLGGGCSGEGTGTASGTIEAELLQNAASINGTIRFFENTTANQITVNGTLANGVLDLYGTITGDISIYSIQITATVEGTSIQGAYTMTDTTTNANIEVGTFTVDK